MSSVRIPEEFAVAVGDPIEGLQKLNVFVGPNNSGKSRLLRSLFKAQPLRFVPADEAYKALADAGQAAGLELSKIAQESRLTAYGGVPLVADVLSTSFIKESTDYAKHLVDRATALSRPGNFEGRVQLAQPIKDEFMRKVQGVGKSFLKTHERLKDQLVKQYNFKKIFIHSLRTLRRVGDNALRNLIAREYFGGYVNPREAWVLAENKGADVLSGEELYAFAQHYLLGTLEQRDAIRDFEEFISTQFFNHKPVNLIPRIRENDQALHIKVGDEKEQPIHELGEGIQQVILLTLPLFFFRKEKVLLFIEEPETNLHPGFQHLFVDVFTSENNSNCQVFVSTHSQQFLDITQTHERALFEVKKTLPGGDHREKTPTFSIHKLDDDYVHLLAELGVRYSSVLLANCTIWVEGITDRMYISHYLDVMRDDLKFGFIENLHYSFVEYGGANITHWAFGDEEPGKIHVERLCARAMLIADRDKKKEKRHGQLKRLMGQRFRPLDRLEIENLLSPEVIRHIINEYAKQEVNTPPFGPEAYTSLGLGNFIDETLLADVPDRERIRKGGFGAASGTIKDKVAFAEKATKYITSSDDMTEEAKKLTEEVAEFIRVHNS